MRHAVRAIAEAGARAAIRGGHPIESTALVAALRAVMGDADAFADLRAGRLVEIPEGGGLDLLAVVSAGGSPSAARTVPAPKSEHREGEAAAAHAELQRAETVLTKARQRAQAADRAVLGAQDRLDAAEKQLKRAQELADERRTELDRVRRDAATAATELADAESVVARLRERPE